MPTFEQIYKYAITHNPQKCQPSIVAYRCSFARAEANYKNIIKYNDVFFREGVVRQNRKDVINNFNNISFFPLSVLYWGFPSNMHGIGTHLFDAYNRVYNICQYLQENREITRNSFKHVLIPMLNECQGLGLAFFSKLFYFSGLKIDGSRCTIFDSRVRKNLRNSCDPALTSLRNYSSGTYSSYCNYISEVEKAAIQIGCNPDCIEYALFTGAQE